MIARSLGVTGPSRERGGAISVRCTIEGLPSSCSVDTSASPVPSVEMVWATSSFGFGTKVCAAVFTALLVSTAGQAPTAPLCSWLACLLWKGGRARVSPAQGGWLVRSAEPQALRADWLADALERLGKEPV